MPSKSRKLGNKFNRCVKSVRSTVKARKGSNKESAAIAICTTSVLHTRGRTLKKYRRGRLVTQRRKRGGMFWSPPPKVAPRSDDLPRVGSVLQTVERERRRQAELKELQDSMTPEQWERHRLLHADPRTLTEKERKMRDDILFSPVTDA